MPSNFLDENVIEMIEDNAYSLFILRLSEIKSILKMLKEVFENSPKVIDNDLLEDICNVLIRLSDECVSAIQNSRCKIYPNENNKSRIW